MGKTTRWLRRIFGLKKPGTPAPPAADPPKQRWRFASSYREKHGSAAASLNGDISAAIPSCGRAASPAQPPRAGPSKRSDAAVTASPAVARATSVRRSAIAPAYVSAPPPREERAAVKIQAAFRAYLARRALRALKALVKLQALVRGHMIRRHTAEYLRRIQALLRAQARARADRVQNSLSPLSSSKHSQLQSHDPATRGMYGRQAMTRQKSTKHGWPSTPTRSASMDKPHSAHSTCSDRGTDKVLEIDIGSHSRRRLLLQPSHPTLSSDRNSHSFSFTTSKSTTHQIAPDPSFRRVESLSLLKYPPDAEDGLFCSAENSPQFFSASSGAGSSKRGLFTPTKSDSSKSYLSDCLVDHPNYMAWTASSRAKVRSLSAPKQRPEFERSRSAKTNSVHGFGDLKGNVLRVAPSRANYANNANKASHDIADWIDLEFQ